MGVGWRETEGENREIQKPDLINGENQLNCKDKKHREDGEK